MGIFGIRKKRDVIDLSERYNRQKEKLKERQEEQKEFVSSFQTYGGESENKSSQTETNNFGFLGNLASASSSNNSSNYGNENSNNYYAGSDNEEKRKRLAKRLMDMTEKIEDLSNQIYHLQQRIEVLERKSGVNKWD